MRKLNGDVYVLKARGNGVIDSRLLSKNTSILLFPSFSEELKEILLNSSLALPVKG